MSKRHRKTKLMFADSTSGAFLSFDGSDFSTPKGRKPKGRHRRESVKRAYYD